jgi:membrane-associated phospholipid phosphatase
VSTAATQVQPQTRVAKAMAFIGAFHLRMALAVSVLLVISLAGCGFTDLKLTGLGTWAIVVLIMFAMVAPLPAYWYEKGRVELLDSTLTVLWAFLLRLIIPLAVLVAARLRMPLEDSFLGSVDDHLHVSVPALMDWASHHRLGVLINLSYAWVIYMLPLAVLVPVLARKSRYAKEFLVANLVSFAVGIPLFALLPAVGPWRYFHFPPTHDQLTMCEAPLLALRASGSLAVASQEAGIVCFPSFHVVWAIFFAASLWGFRRLRIPVAVVSAIVILSTMTTGWHYFVDVVGGILLAIVSLVAAKRLLRQMDPIGP